MRKTVLIPLLVLSVVALAWAGTSQANARHAGKVTLRLSAVPAVHTGASGTAVFEINRDATAIRYRIDVSRLENVTMGHIHEVGDDGTPATVLTWLYPVTGEKASLREGVTKGTLAEGEITAEKLGGPLKGKTVKELYEELASGKAGVAIHTRLNPGGELWAYRKGKEHKKM